MIGWRFFVVFFFISTLTLTFHKNFNSLYEFLVTLSFSPDIICLTETKLKGEALINIDLPLYKFNHVDGTTAAGGVAIYVSNKLQFEVCPNQHVLNLSQCLWLELSENSSNNSKSKFIVGVVGLSSSRPNQS